MTTTEQPAPPSERSVQPQLAWPPGELRTKLTWLGLTRQDPLPDALVHVVPAPHEFGHAPGTPRARRVDRGCVLAATILGGLLVVAFGKLLAGSVALPALFVAYTRFSNPTEVLRDERRRAVLSAIREQPGVGITQLARLLAVDRRTILRHTDHLQRWGLVRTISLRGRTAFYPTRAVALGLFTIQMPRT